MNDKEIPSRIKCIYSHHLQKYRNSLPRSSNASSVFLLSDVLNSHLPKFENSVNSFISEVQNIAPQLRSNYRNEWKTSLHNVPDPMKYLEKNIDTCEKCELNYNNFKGLHNFVSKECRCNLGLVENLQYSKNNASVETSRLEALSKNIIPENLNTNTEDEIKQTFKPKFGRTKGVQSVTLKVVVSNRDDVDKVKYTDIQKEDEELKSHKSNVAKLTFKTAREQLMANNPAMKRTLGATKRAQGKFVSPMIGTQDKQDKSETIIADERLKHLDPKMIELIESEIIDKGSPVAWDDIAGLEIAKSVIQEAVVWPILRPDIFTGLRRPPKGILLFGPPGTGKTLIGKCVAAQCNATFFSISASSLTSKWMGDGEKMVRALFAVARCHQPAVIFIDEIDSLLTQRSDSEHEATRRIKTEFLVQFDGAATEEEDRVLIVGATNRPQELDEAARRRLVKRLYIPLPDLDARKTIICNLLRNERNDLTTEQICEVASLTNGYSGADMKSLCSEAAMGPIRTLPMSQIASIDSDKVRSVCLQDFINALQRVRPSVSQDDLRQYEIWNKTYGHGFEY